MSALNYGIVKVIGGMHKGRIGFYDDDDYENNKKTAIVYFSSFVLADHYCLIQHRFLKEANIKDLIVREKKIKSAMIYVYNTTSLDEYSKQEIKLDLISEAHLISQHLALRRFIWTDQSDPHFPRREINIFISYSNKDKAFAEKLAKDLEHIGLKVWFDQWKIFAGDSIPKKLSKGSKHADFMLILFSNTSKASVWQEKEWEAKFVQEVNDDSIYLIPLKLTECEIPHILESKKYISFIGRKKNNQIYQKGFEEILKAIRHHLEKKVYYIQSL